MPSLSSALNSKRLVRGPDGQLTEQTPEEVQSLSDKAGLASPPITPLGTAMIGGNQDQAKMAGTKAQKSAALDLASQQQPGQSLADAVRRGQGNERSQATGQEAAGMQKSEDLQALGGLGDRVNDFINAQRAKLAGAQPVEVQAAQTFNNKDVTQLKPLLAQLRANPQDMDLQLQVNQALGYDIKQQLSPEQINSLYEDSVSAITRGGAGSVDNDLTVNDLIAQGDFGYDSAELSHLLGVPEDQIKSMNVGQLRNAVSQVQADEFSSTNQLEQKAGSGELGGAERALARQGAREASRVGTRSSEADVQHLEQQISNADEVQFGGKNYGVEDLLKDDTISGIISDYMNSAPGSDTRKQLEATEPGLIQFVQKNQALLQDASQHLSQGAQQFTDVQSFNKSLVAGLPDNLKNLVAPEAGSLQAGKIDVNSKPLLAWVQKNPQAAQALQGLADDDARALSSLDADTLNGLQIGQKGGKWDQYQQDKQKVNDLKQRASQVTNPEEIMSLIFNGKGPTDIHQLDRTYATQRNAAALGLPNSAGDFDSLDPNHDGHVESPGALLESYKQRLGSFSLQDALSGKKPGEGTFSSPTDVSQKWNQEQNQVYDKLRGALDDGKVDYQELKSSGLNSSELVRNIDWNAPAFKNSAADLVKITANRSMDEVTDGIDTSTLAGALKAQQAMQKDLKDLSGELAKKGVQGSEVQDAYAHRMDDLSRQISDMQSKEKSTQDAKMKPSQDLADSLQKSIAALDARTKQTGSLKTSGLSTSVRPDGTVVLTDKSGKVVAQGKDAKAFSAYI